MVKSLIIAGPPSSGKRLLSRKLATEYGLSYLPLDILLLPRPKGPTETALPCKLSIFLSSLKSLLCDLLDEGFGFVGDTSLLEPRHISEVWSQTGLKPEIFLWYRAAKKKEHAQHTDKAAQQSLR